MWDPEDGFTSTILSGRWVDVRRTTLSRIGRGDPVVNGKGTGHDPTSHQQSSLIPCQCGLM